LDSLELAMEGKISGYSFLLNELIIRRYTDRGVTDSDSDVRSGRWNVSHNRGSNQDGIDDQRYTLFCGAFKRHTASGRSGRATLKRVGRK
jgi:hypothetical protein